MIDDIRAARDAALAESPRPATVDDVATLDAELLGKRGALAQLKTRLGVAGDRRREAGRRPGASTRRLGAVDERDRGAPRRARRRRARGAASRPSGST